VVEVEERGRGPVRRHRGRIGESGRGRRWRPVCVPAGTGHKDSLSRAGSPARIATGMALLTRIATVRPDVGAGVSDAAIVAEPRITLLGRPRCHLCEYAREALERVRQATGVSWV